MEEGEGALDYARKLPDSEIKFASIFFWILTFMLLGFQKMEIGKIASKKNKLSITEATK